MKFDLTFKGTHRLSAFEYEVNDNEKTLLEDLHIVQDALEQAKGVKFTLECLGEDWDTFIFYDFTLFTEHLWDIYDLCYKEPESSYLMWYYEQGIDRKILFTKVENERIKVENISGESWISPVPYEYLRIVDLKGDIKNFVWKIKEAVEVIYPELNNLEMLQKWYKSFES